MFSDTKPPTTSKVAFFAHMFPLVALGFSPQEPFDCDDVDDIDSFHGHYCGPLSFFPAELARLCQILIFEQR